MQRTDGRDANANILDLYLREVRTIPLLSREEELGCAKRAARGDRNAKDTLIRANLRFVVFVAKRYRSQGLPLDDLISEGNIGLMNAIDCFDPERGIRFISYAIWWIRQAVLKAIAEKSRMIRLPMNRANKLLQIEKVRLELQAERGEEPNTEQIAQNTGIDPDLVDTLISVSREITSLDTPVFEQEDSSPLAEYIEDTDSDSPDDEVLNRSLQEEINAVLAALNRRESDIIQHRFGLNGRNVMSLRAIGNRYNVSKERIRQIEKNALRKIKRHERRECLEAYVS